MMQWKRIAIGFGALVALVLLVLALRRSSSASSEVTASLSRDIAALVHRIEKVEATSSSTAASLTVASDRAERVERLIGGVVEKVEHLAATTTAASTRLDQVERLAEAVGQAQSKMLDRLLGESTPQRAEPEAQRDRDVRVPRTSNAAVDEAVDARFRRIERDVAELSAAMEAYLQGAVRGGGP